MSANVSQLASALDEIERHERALICRRKVLLPFYAIDNTIVNIEQNVTSLVNRYYHHDNNLRNCYEIEEVSLAHPNPNFYDLRARLMRLKRFFGGTHTPVKIYFDFDSNATNIRFCQNGTFALVPINNFDVTSIEYKILRGILDDGLSAQKNAVYLCNIVPVLFLLIDCAYMEAKNSWISLCISVLFAFFGERTKLQYASVNKKIDFICLDMVKQISLRAYTETLECEFLPKLEDCFDVCNSKYPDLCSQFIDIRTLTSRDEYFYLWEKIEKIAHFMKYLEPPAVRSIANEVRNLRR